MSRIPYKPNKWDYPRFVAFSIIYVAFLILFSPFFLMEWLWGEYIELASSEYSKNHPEHCPTCKQRMAS
jgi:hypothetical protein